MTKRGDGREPAEAMSGGPPAGGEQREARPRHFELLAELSRDIMLLLRRDDGRILEANAAAVAAYGYTRDELLRLSIHDLRTREDRHLADAQMAEAEERGMLFETRHRRKDGSTFLVEVSSRGATIDGTRALVSVARDITDRKLAEAAAERSRHWFERVAATTPDIIFVLDIVASRNVYANRGVLEILGYSPDEFARVPDIIHAAIHPDDCEQAARFYGEMCTARPGEVRVVTHRSLHKDGSTRWLEVRVTPFGWDETGAVREVIGLARDISERKQAEETLQRALAEADERGRLLDALMQYAPEGITIVDTALNVRHVSRHGQQLLGASPDGMTITEVAGQWQVFGPDGRTPMPEEHLPIVRAVRGGELVQNQEVVQVNARGQRLSLLCNAAPIRSASGEITGGIVAWRDVTERRATEKKFATLLASIRSGFCLLDLEGRLLEVNEAYCRMLGYAQEELIGRSVSDVEASETPEEVRRKFATARRYGNAQFETRHRRKDGSIIDVDVRVTFLELGEARVVAFVWDITDRKRVERERDAAKSAAEEASRAKDHFLAVLSHELRTPLAPVLTGIALLESSEPLSERARGVVGVMRRNVELEARLIDDLLDLTRITRGKTELDRRPVSLATIIDRAVEVCHLDIEARKLAFAVEHRGGPYVVDGDAARLQQVFWNLLKNAIKFTSPGGAVAVRCRPGDGHVVVDVSDSGVGFEPDAVGLIFDAFAQAEHAMTKQFGGLGLGLTISKALVEAHGGTIEAFSGGANQGATFRVRLPLAHAADDALAGAERYAPPARPRGLRVLLVEDHPDSAEMMAAMLSLEGHDVQTARDVGSALKLVDRATFDLLISDLGLPDRSGLELMRELRARGLRLPGIALSGYGQERDIEQSRQAGFLLHLVKPAEPGRLLEAMEQAVGKRT